MPTVVPYLRIEQELPSRLTLVSANRRWLILMLTLILTLPLILISVLLLTLEEVWPLGVVGILAGPFILAPILLFTPYKSHLTIDSYLRKVNLKRFYWLGFGALERDREKEWSFNDITQVNLKVTRLIEIEAHNKKELVLNFGSKAKDAQRSYNLVQSWLKGFTPDSLEATTALQELAGEKQKQDALLNAKKLLNYFGIFSLLSGALGVFTDISFTTEISIATALSIVTGLIYLACAYGAKHRSEVALWVAILVVVAERAYWFIMSGTLSGEGEWSSWLTWIFAFFVVSSLWKAIQSIRAMEENPVYEPLA